MDIFLATLFVLICILLIAVILLQKGRGGGLSGAFGGAGGHSAFGSRTGDMFTWVTVVLVGLFLVMGAALVLKFQPRHAEVNGPTVQAPTETATAPTAAATETGPATPESAPADETTSQPQAVPAPEAPTTPPAGQ